MDILNRLSYIFAGLIYLSWTVAILIGFWYVDLYLVRFPLTVEIGVTAPAIVLAFMAFSFIHTGFSKYELPK